MIWITAIKLVCFTFDLSCKKGYIYAGIQCLFIPLHHNLGPFLKMNLVKRKEKEKVGKPCWIVLSEGKATEM